MLTRGLIQVFSNGWFVLLAATTAFVIFVLTTWLGNLGLIWQIITSGGLPLVDKLGVMVALTGSIGTNFTIFSAACTIAIAILFGLNLAVMIYAVRERQMIVRQSGPALSAASLGGLISGLFGIGCAACGTFLLSPALAFLGVGTFITLLPFGGEEFSALGVAILGLALVLSARKIGQPIMCPILTATKFPTSQKRGVTR